jgi:hypothetical protein
MVPELGQEFISVQLARRYTECQPPPFLVRLFQARLVLSGKKMAGKSAESRKKDAVKQEADQQKSPDLWIAPKPRSTNGTTTRKWSEPPSSPPGSRLLELADIALGLKKPENFRKRRSGALKPKP